MPHVTHGTFRRTIALACVVAGIGLGGKLAGAGELFQIPLDALSRLVAQASAPSPAPSPSPSPRPRVHHGFLGDGPITLTGMGNIDLNTRRNGRNGITDDTTGYLSSGQVGLERRTEASVFSLSQGIGYSSGQTSYGQIQAGYRTPIYSLDYGAVDGGGDTQLQIGGFARGVTFSKPLRNGTIEVIGAAAFQQNSSGYRAIGVRRLVQHKSSSETLTLLNENALHGTGSNRIVDYSLKSYAQHGTIAFEAALAQPNGLIGPSGETVTGNELAFGMSIDRASRHGYASLSLLTEPNGFASLNQVQLPTQQAQAILRRDFGNSSSLAFNFGADASNQDGNDTTDRRATATFSTQVRGVGVTLLDNIATSHASDQDSINRGIGAILNETIFATTLSESYQNATTNGTGGLATNSAVTFNESRNVGRGGYLTLTQSYGRSGTAGATGTFTDEEASFVKTLGQKLDLNLGVGEQRQGNGGTVTPTSTVTLGFTRRLSRVVSIRVTSVVAHQGGALPGTSTSFTADLVGPFAFGSAATSGRINPNLPASVRGRVYSATSTSDPFAGAAVQRGFGNVLVLLDGVQAQRTDATGEYEFRFVKPGLHTVSIEQASLGAGLVADRRTQTFKILGGQTQSVDFAVGNFAGIQGRVFTRINGEDAGIPDVVVTIDDLERVTTDADGQFSIGRLTAGAHRVMIDPASLPSNAQLEGGFAAKTVTAILGTSVNVDFHAQRLGSITGTVLYASENGFGDLKGAKDVYVVANPGDHAAITDPDGTFIIDNLAPGKYMLTVDKDTLPDGQDVIQGPDDAIDVFPEAKITGIVFKLGTGAKEVVFTFNGTKKAPVSVSTDIADAPPGAYVHVTVKPSGKPKTVRIETDNFGNFFLKEDKENGTWTGAFVVPTGTQKGTYAIHAAVDGDEKGADTVLSVSPAIALTTVRMAPAHPSPGHTIHVVARILANVSEGDTLRFIDGYTIKLPKPKGRVFAFDMRLWSHGLPYTGTIVTKEHALVPFVLK